MTPTLVLALALDPSPNPNQVEGSRDEARWWALQRIEHLARLKAKQGRRPDAETAEHEYKASPGASAAGARAGVGAGVGAASGVGSGVRVRGRAVAGRATGETRPSPEAGSRQTRHCALWPDLSLRCSPPWQGAPAEVAGVGVAGVQSPAGPGREVMLDLRGVVRVLPALAREPSSFAIELWELSGDGARRRHRLEPALWEEAEALVLALRLLLPSEAFVTSRCGALEWRHFPRPTTDPAFVVYPHHPLSTLGPPEEAAAALVTLCNLRGHRLVAADSGAPRALMHALAESAGAGSIDLDGRALGWSEEMLELVLLALVHSPHLRGLRLRRFALGAACCRAVAALLRHSAVLESLQLSGCALHPGCAGAWAEAIAANQLLPLTVLAVGATCPTLNLSPNPSIKSSTSGLG